MEKYVVRLIGSKPINITISLPELSKSSVHRTENKITAETTEGIKFPLRVVTPALWEKSQNPLVNHWELNQALIDAKVVGLEDRICTSFGAPDELQYSSSPVKAAKMQEDNHLIDDILPEDLPTSSLEEQIETSMDEEEEYQAEKENA